MWQIGKRKIIVFNWSVFQPLRFAEGHLVDKFVVILLDSMSPYLFKLMHH